MRRRAGLLGLLGAFAACGFDASGHGNASGDASGTEASTTLGSSTTATSTGTGSSSSNGTSSGSSSSTTSSSGPTSSSAGSSSAGSSGAGSSGGPTSESDTDGGGLQGDDAVLVRYYLDEQSGGAPSGTVLDAAPGSPFDLEVTYDDASSSPVYVEDDGHRGLHWSSHGLPGQARGVAMGTKLMDLDGQPAATLEVVVDMQSVFTSEEPWARIVVWQPDIVPYNVQMGLLGFWDNDAIALDVRSAWQVDNDPPTGRWSLADAPGRIVVHAVFDTSLQADERVRLFIDGVLAAPTSLAPPAQDAVLTVSEDALLVLGNRPAGDTSFGGTLYYAAIYGRALSTAEVTANAGILGADDDGPPR